jgi:RNA polymerase subunit RPABC4/transcription elongation factor Spt4
MIKLKKLSLIVLTGIIISLTISIVATAVEEPWNWYSSTSGGGEWFFFGLGLTVCLVFFLIPLIIAILACIWIYKDAEKRSKSGAIWVILLIVASLFGSFIGFIIVIVVWLAIRPPIGGVPQQMVSSSDRRCPNCGRVIPMDARVCPYCGKKFNNHLKEEPDEDEDVPEFCNKCGAKLAEDAEFCTKCSAKVK